MDSTTEITTPRGALETALPAPVTRADKKLARVQEAALVGTLVTQKNCTLLSVLKSDQSGLEQIEAVQEYRGELSKQVDGMEAPDGVKQVIQWLTILENTSEGIELLDVLEQQDLLDMTNPLIVIGTILYFSKNRMNRTEKNKILNEILETLSDDQIADLILSINDLEGLDDQEKMELKDAFVRILVNQACELTDTAYNMSTREVSEYDFGLRSSYGDRDDVEIHEKDLLRGSGIDLGETLVDRNYLDIFGTNDTEDPLIKVLHAITAAGESQLEEELLNELAINAGKASRLNRKYGKVGDDNKDKVGPWVKSVDRFAEILSTMITEKLPTTRKYVMAALEIITTTSTKAQPLMLPANIDDTSADEAPAETTTVDEGDLEL